jgi:hypothetical protein
LLVISPESHYDARIHEYEIYNRQIGHRNTRYFWQILTKIDFSFKKYSNLKFHENSFSASRVVPCGQTGTTKLVFVFHEFFFKYSNLKYHENPFSRNRVVPCGQTGTTKLVVVFREKVFKNIQI